MKIIYSDVFLKVWVCLCLETQCIALQAYLHVSQFFLDFHCWFIPMLFDTYGVVQLHWVSQWISSVGRKDW